MTSDHIIFAGVELTFGRKPVTFAGLDADLNIRMLEKWDRAEVLGCLQIYDSCLLAINIPSAKQGREIYGDLKEDLVQAGFKPFSQKTHPKQWLETNAQDCFDLLSGHKLFPRRALEGRLQRSAILYEQGLQISDPVDIFEEITRYKLIQGILPLENLPSSKELDALVSAYLAWMTFNRPGLTVPRGEFVLPAQE
ncbi:MAG TPA: hypothetical protein VMN99_05135 [Anaerolineales bacterium]|nr:hypothetical protein [Anaerolineales bacterium]